MEPRRPERACLFAACPAAAGRGGRAGRLTTRRRRTTASGSSTASSGRTSTGEVQKGSAARTARWSTSWTTSGSQDERTFEARSSLPVRAADTSSRGSYTPLDYAGDADAPGDVHVRPDATSCAASAW